MSYRVQTQNFTGPFDLLLSLVSKQKVSIESISISEVTDQYLAEVDHMGELDLDVASDFVLVASTLLAIKAQSLVPLGDDLKHSSDEDYEDDDLAELSPDEAKEVLIARLIAYKQFRNAGAALNARMEQESRMFGRSCGIDPEFLDVMPNYLEGISLRSLAVICADLDSKRESFLLEAEHIAPKRMPIALTLASVDRVVRNKGKVNFSELLENKRSPENLVATFLAVLELYKQGIVTLLQAHTFGEIEIEHVKDAPAYQINPSEFDEDL